MDTADHDPDFSGPTVTVHGDAYLRVEPDEAVLWVTLSSLEHAPAPALSNVSARSTALVALLDALGVSKADRTTTGITVHEEFDHPKAGRRSIGHRARVSVSVRLSDPELIGKLISQATADLAAEIDGPRWLISRDNPVRLDAARQSAANARRRAQAYAEGVGAKLGRLVRLSEPGLRGPGRTYASYDDVALSSAAIPVERGEQDVSAFIDATFTLELG